MNTCIKAIVHTDCNYPSKGISIAYNLLNLPQIVTVPGGTVTYTYDAMGNKLRKVAVISSVTTATDYISGVQYKNNGPPLASSKPKKAKRC